MVNKFLLKVKKEILNFNLKDRMFVLLEKFENFDFKSLRLKYYFKIWLKMSKNSFLMILAQKKLFFVFLLGKIIRFFFYLGFLYFILQKTESLAGYTMNQTIFIFLTFNLIDIVSQFLFREVYRFRSLLVSGDFDLVLVKPHSPLFKVLMGSADATDLITIPPLIVAMIYLGNLLNPDFFHILVFITLLLNGFIITTSFHIIVLAMGIITMEIDHLIMIYRDVVELGKFPVDIYKEPIKSILTFVVPVGIMITFPAKFIFGILSPIWTLVSITIGFLIFIGAIRFWNFALKRYESASS